ncbi:MAG: pH regulation protein F [Gemmatimonadales bacterium]|nr:MAG: pH regulation protein F [Gemmatimonadales bacterium]
MIEVLTGLAVFISILIAVTFYRVLVGPTLYDRLLAVGAIGTYAVLLLALIGFIYERPSGFLDLAITYAILNFVGVVAIAKYLDLDSQSASDAAGGTEE